MIESLEILLSTRFNKKELVATIKKRTHLFENLFSIALTDKQPQAWRATWLLGHCMEKNDKRLQGQIKNIIESLKICNDGHQREWLKVLEKMTINENYEGSLFDVCLTIWESINKSPSVRIVAFRVLVKIVKKYPELKHEVESLTQIHFTETLSPGINRSFDKLQQELKNINIPNN